MHGDAGHSSHPPSGTVTFLFTDIEGSTRLLQELGEQYADVLMEQRRLLRDAFQGRGGREIDAAGDAFFVAFDRARDAVAAAVAAQQSLLGHAWPGGQTLRVRMGLHTGEPAVQGGSYVGLDVHRGARICAAGHGGQILLSEATRELVRESLPEGMSLRDLGRHQLKDLPHPERLFQVILPGLPSEFPPLRTRPGLSGNLPVESNALIGRDEEVEAVRRLLQDAAVRVVTLTGPGGTGKTRLALQIARGLADAFPDGAYFVALAPISDPDLLASSISGVLGIRESPARPVLESVKESLEHKQLLLVLDNFEQIVTAAPVVAELLAGCHGLQVLITSRVVLHLSVEHEFQVPPLDLPDLARLPDPTALEQYSAVALFLQRARAVRSSFTLSKENAAAIAGICARLDGLPLAIELAAARIKVLAAQAILDRLASRLDFLRGGAHDLPARHQTLRGAIAWSYDLLADHEKAFFQRMAVFSGGCTLEAAQRVGVADGRPGMDALDGVTALVDKSLLRQEESPAYEPRFVMLETIREYGVERLKSAGGWEAARRAHAMYFLGLAEQAEPELTGPAQPQWLDRLEREHDNLRAALTWAEDPGEGEIGLRLGAALWRFWVVRGHLHEGHDRLERLLTLPGAAARTGSRARVLHGLGTIIHEMGHDYREARGFVEDSLSIWRELGDKRGTATALNSLGWLAFHLGEFDRARALSEEALLLHQELGEKRGAAVALFNVGSVALHRSDYPTALSLFDQSIALRREIGDRRGCAYVQVSLAWVEHQRGNHGRAAAILVEALTVLRELNDRQLVAWALSYQGMVAHDVGDLGRARVTLEEGLSLARGVGNNLIIAWALIHLADVLQSQGEIAAALPLLEEGVSMWRAIARWGLPVALHFRGSMAATAGEHDRAHALFRESLQLWSRLGTRRGVAEALEGLGALASIQGEPTQAVRLYAAAEAIRQTIGAPRPPRKRTAYERDLARLRLELGEDDFARAWAEGLTLTPEQACG